MRIISDFKDYYDSLMANDADREEIYLRKYHRVVFNATSYGGAPLKSNAECTYTQGGNPLGVFERSFYGPVRSVYYTGCVLGIGDTIYPYIERRPCGTIYLDPESVAQGKDEASPALKKSAADFFENCKLINIESYREKHKAAVWWGMAGSDHHKGIYSLHLNPRLLEVVGPHVHKIVSMYDAYQQIRIWISNRGRPVTPVPVMSNDVKIHQAGFDLKTSFRRPKG